MVRPLKATASVTEEGPPTRVVVQGPSLISRVFGTTQRFVVAAIETLVLLYFLLASGDLFLQKLLNVLPRFDDKQTAVHVARKIEAYAPSAALTSKSSKRFAAAVALEQAALTELRSEVIAGHAAHQPRRS